MNSPLQTEPAVTVATGVSALMALLVYYGVLDVQGAGVWTTFGIVVIIPFLQALITRMHVFSENTIRDAGLDPAAVEERASDPQIPRCNK